jgi:hypothetical protein
MLATPQIYLVNYPKCGENNWIETNAKEEGKI